MQEHIVNACIRWRTKGTTSPEYVKGVSHADCLSWFSCADIYENARDMEFEKEGFMTNTDRFVDRQEAYTIAEAAGQLRCTRPDRTLYSHYLICKPC